MEHDYNKQNRQKTPPPPKKKKKKKATQKKELLERFKNKNLEEKKRVDHK
jgi:hypothetical protein